MKLKDLHVHTAYSDGADTPEEMILAAIELGLDTIGFSDHSYTDFDESYCMKRDRIAEYKSEIAALKEKYQGRITVLCGIEQDYYSSESTAGYDYVIGSVHYVTAHGVYIPIDEDAGTLINAVNEHFRGDIYALAEEYYRTLSDVVRKTQADIIGHFDLITKFNEAAALFDVNNPRYIAAWRSAADALLKFGVPCEINTGAVLRGYRTEPYPARDIREYIAARGGTFIYSSDSHSRDAICFGFRK